MSRILEKELKAFGKKNSMIPIKTQWLYKIGQRNCLCVFLVELLKFKVFISFHCQKNLIVLIEHDYFCALYKWTKFVFYILHSSIYESSKTTKFKILKSHLWHASPQSIMLVRSVFFYYQRPFINYKENSTH